MGQYINVQLVYVAGHRKIECREDEPGLKTPVGQRNPSPKLSQHAKHWYSSAPTAPTILSVLSTLSTLSTISKSGGFENQEGCETTMPS